MITMSIDVTLLDKARFREGTRKNGAKAVWCDIILIETPNSQYGAYMVKQGQTKEQRAAGEQSPILGNAKVMEKRGSGPAPKASGDDDGPVPF